MSDTQAAMREFRFLDEKRKAGGLSQPEEQRWLDLGGQLGMTAQQGYYGEDGAWYTYPPGYDPQTGQYYAGYQQPQSQWPAPSQPPYYDPNAGYYPPQQPGHDPNAGYYPPQQGYDPNVPYDPNQPQGGYDPNAQGYEQPPPQQQWDPQAQQQQWPANYDPNTGQYYDPGYQQPQPQYPGYAPPSAPQAPSWQPAAPYVPTPVYVAPRPAPSAPAPVPAPFNPSSLGRAILPPRPVTAPVAASEEDGPVEVAEDEVMEVTDDDVTLLDSSPPLAPVPAAPKTTLGPEKPLTRAPVYEAPAAVPADLLGDLRSSLSFDEAPPTASATQIVPAAQPAPLEPSIDLGFDLEATAPSKPLRIAEPIVEPAPVIAATVEPAPMILDAVAEPAPRVLDTVAEAAPPAIAPEPIAPPAAAAEPIKSDFEAPAPLAEAAPVRSAFDAPPAAAVEPAFRSVFDAPAPVAEAAPLRSAFDAPPAAAAEPAFRSAFDAPAPAPAEASAAQAPSAPVEMTFDAGPIPTEPALVAAQPTAFRSVFDDPGPVTPVVPPALPGPAAGAAIAPVEISFDSEAIRPPPPSPSLPVELSFDPEPAAAKPLFPVEPSATTEPPVAPLAPSTSAIALEAEEVSLEPDPGPAPLPARTSDRVSGEAEMPSIMVGEDLGAEVFAARPMPVETQAPAELPSLGELSNLLGAPAAPPPPPPPSQPEPSGPPMALTHVAPISATDKDLYPDRPPAPLAPAAAAPSPELPVFEPTAANTTPAWDEVPAPRPSIPLSIHVEEPVFEHEPLLDASVDVSPEPAPAVGVAAAPLFAASFDDIPVGHEPEPPASTHTGFEASLGDLPPSIANEPPPPIVDAHATPMDFDVAVDDKPLPVEVPMDLGGDAGDKIELAKTSDFLSFPAASAPDSSSFSGDGESLVESGTLATMANPSAPNSPMPQEAASVAFDDGGASPTDAVPLASNSDFLGMSELNNTGEQWTKREGGLSLDEGPGTEAPPIDAEVVQGEIVQGIELEEEILEFPAEPEAEVELQAEWSDPPAPAPPPPAPAPPAPAPPAPAPPAPALPAPAPVAAAAPRPSLAIPAPAPTQWPAAAVGVKAAAAAPPAAAPRPPAPPGPPVKFAATFAPLTPGRDRSLFGSPGEGLQGDAATVIKGEHRVILHTVEGQVKRGALRDANLGDDVIALEAQPGAQEKIPRARVKAIFFMLPAGQKAPVPSGDKLRVTFRDGRQLAGFSVDHRGEGIGFFVVPADNRTNTERIFIYRSSVEKISVD